MQSVLNYYFCTVELRYNKGPRDWQNLFATIIIRFCYFKVLFHIFYNYISGVVPRTLLYRGSLNRGSSVFV